MSKIIDLEAALKLGNCVFVDVRTLQEYNEGHIPGAFNIPLFDLQERAEVGTIYKQVGQQEAKRLGLKIVSQKLPGLIEKIGETAERKTAVVYCWRGGMRSRSVADVLDLMGISSFQLTGGYKAYRKYVLDRLATYKIRPVVAVIHGLTGVGKTILIQKLREMGEPAIDLEGIANHRGSVFGPVGLGAGVSAKSFDALLLLQLQKYQDREYIIVECESKRIGNVYLPDVLFNAMRDGIHILVHCSLATRVERLMAEYLNPENFAEIETSICLLERRIGKKQVDKYLTMFRSGEHRQLIGELLVKYYDPLYNYDLNKAEHFDLVACAEDLSAAAGQIREFLQGKGVVLADDGDRKDTT